MLVRSFGAPSSPPSPRSCCTALAAPLLASIGAPAALAQANGGSWSAVFDWSPQLVPLAPVGCVSEAIGHAALIPTGVHRGKVLIWNAVNSVTGDCHVTTKTFLVDPASPSTLIELIHPPLASMIFCSGTTWDADGNLKVVGGED